jgi:hypothetical protein
MRSWSCERRVETTASAEAVWAVWSDWRRWPEWDEAIEWIEGGGPDGNAPFEAGATGRMKPKGGPAMRTVMLEASEPLSFTGRSLFPLCPMDAYHVYEPPRVAGRPARILHRVTFRGLIAPLMGLLIGKRIEAELETSMAALVARAEASDADLDKSADGAS